MPNSLDSIIVFGDSPVEERQAPVDPGHLIAGDPLHTLLNYYDDDTGQYRAGIWASTEGKWHAFGPRNEFCHMLAGRVRLADKDGNSKIFSTGDSFVITPAFHGTWEVLEDARKLYVIFEAGQT